MKQPLFIIIKEVDLRELHLEEARKATSADLLYVKGIIDQVIAERLQEQKD